MADYYETFNPEAPDFMNKVRANRRKSLRDARRYAESGDVEGLGSSLWRLVGALSQYGRISLDTKLKTYNLVVRKLDKICYEKAGDSPGAREIKKQSDFVHFCYDKLREERYNRGFRKAAVNGETERLNYLSEYYGLNVEETK